MADIIELILDDHRRAGRLQASLREASCSADGGRAEVLASLWERLAGLIELHLAAGREVCWLAMARPRRDGLTRVRQLADDAGDTAEAIAEARLQPPGSPAWWQAADAALRYWAMVLECEKELLAEFVTRASRARREQLAGQRLAFLATRQDGEEWGQTR
jgi:hypothetical protein